jgi:hypothetical protein
MLMLVGRYMKSEFESNLRHLARKMLLVRSLEAGSFCATAAGLVSVGVVWAASWFADIGMISLIPLGIMLIGGFAGAMLVLLRGINFTQVARFLDSRYTLPQHLSTGAELLENTPNSPDSDVAACVYNRGLLDIKSLPPRINFWTLTRRTGFALLLTIAICGLLAVGVLGAGEGGIKLSEISAVKRAELERAYRDAAIAEQNPRNREGLLAAAEAIKINDAHRFNQIIQQLRREGLELSLSQISSGALGSNRAGKGGSLPDVKNVSTKNSTSDGASPANVENQNRGEFRVLVYDPGYSRGASKASDFGVRSVPRSVPLQSAWEEACQHAASDLQDGKVPVEYRDIVRRFFTNKDFGEVP